VLLDQISVWGYAAIGLAIALGGLGVPISEEAVFGAAGWLIQQGRLSPAGVLAVGICSVLLVDNGGFWIGRLGGRRLSRQQVHASRLSSCAALGRLLAGRYGPLTVFVARFIPGVRVVAGPLAGLSGLHPLRFAIPNAAGAVCYVSGMVSVGYALVPRLSRALPARALWAIVPVAAAVVFAIWRSARIVSRWSRSVPAFAPDPGPARTIGPASAAGPAPSEPAI
jgi:membrane protein DedA with SNARE-associated domain